MLRALGVVHSFVATLQYNSATLDPIRGCFIPHVLVATVLNPGMPVSLKVLVPTCIVAEDSRLLPDILDDGPGKRSRRRIQDHDRPTSPLLSRAPSTISLPSCHQSCRFFLECLFFSIPPTYVPSTSTVPERSSPKPVMQVWSIDPCP